MRRKVKPEKNIILKIFELLGKPAFFLFTFFIVFLAALFSLITNLIRRLSSIKAPKFSLHLPKLSFPKFRPSFHIPPFLLLLPVVTLFLIVFFYWYVFKDLPDIHLLADSPPSLSTKIYDRNGKLLFTIYKDQNRSLVHLDDLPPYVVQATLAAEDKNFYSHPGIDLFGIVRAAVKDLKNCRLKTDNCGIQGGSTITQQLIKNTLLTPEKSFRRKLKEAVLAIEAERAYSKSQIMEMYLNQVAYGGTAYGIEEASLQYFGIHAKDLSLNQAALLAGLPVSPTTYSPFGTNPYLAKMRQQQVLEAMVEARFLSKDTALAAKSSPLILHPKEIAILAPHFVMYIKDLLVQTFGEDLVARGGLEVTTTLDLDKQNVLQHEIDLELAKLQSLHVGNAAGMIVNPSSGDILAMVGSHNFFDSTTDGQVNVTLQPRQPGSSIKPITYALAFINGLTPSTLIDDSPICYVQTGSADWCPQNYDGRFHGRVPIRVALGSSYNVPATKVLNSLGVMNMVTLARELGITTWNDPSRFGLSLTLGGGEVTMLDMAQVYSNFANSGIKIPLRSLLSVKDSYGHNLDLPTLPPPREVLPPGVAWEINSILSDASARAPAFGVHSVLNLPAFPQVAVKTGTTNDLRDNWTFGYTPHLLVATWVGNNDNSPMSHVASGITGASPIWSRTMMAILQGSTPEPFLPPENMVKAVASCSGSAPRYDYFLPGTAPKIDCSQVAGKLLDSAASTGN